MRPPRRGARTVAHWLWRPFRVVLLALLVVVIFIEEWGWRPAGDDRDQRRERPPLASLEQSIRNAPRRVALALFLVPALLLFPVKLAALWLIQDGRATLGITVIVVAKVLGTAFVGRLFILVETQLMTFPWFARSVFWWRATRERVMAALRRSFVWRIGHAFRRIARRWLGRLRDLGARS